MPLGPGENVVVPKHLDTGVLVEVSEDTHHVLLDFVGQRLELDEGDLRTFRWRYRNTFGRFLVVATAKLSPFRRNRHLTIQYHVIRDNGSISGRVERIRRINGVTRTKW